MKFVFILVFIYNFTLIASPPNSNNNCYANFQSQKRENQKLPLINKIKKDNETSFHFELHNEASINQFFAAWLFNNLNYIKNNNSLYRPLIQRGELAYLLEVFMQDIWLGRFKNRSSDFASELDVKNYQHAKDYRLLAIKSEKTGKFEFKTREFFDSEKQLNKNELLIKEQLLLEDGVNSELNLKIVISLKGEASLQKEIIDQYNKLFNKLNNPVVASTQQTLIEKLN